MSLYTKYRPRDWDSVVGQDTISSILRESLRSGRVGHAYIMTGSRGTGKTTSARILAEWVNCTNLRDGNPCHECVNCTAFESGSMLDVIEIDGASNNWVENVRDLIEKSRFEPNQWQFKVYIIDEVHMLSTGAFNALLKTLEEPPPHVKFILATTEIDKVPETIRSRALRFDFRKISIEDIVRRLEYVCQTEWIQADREALEIIARAARGGMRDALTLTEQNTINGSISADYVRSTLSLLEDALVESIITALVASDHGEIRRIIDTLSMRHVEVRGFFDQMLYTLRDHLFATLDTPEFAVYESILRVFEDAYSRVRSIPDGFLLIEITLLRGLRRDTTSNISWAPASHASPSTPVTSGKTSKKEELIEKTVTASVEPITIEPVSAAPLTDTRDSIALQETKDDKPAGSPFSYLTLLNKLKSIKPALVADLKNARFEKEETHLVLIFNKKWNYDRVNTPIIQWTLLETLTTTFGGMWTLATRLEEWSTSIVDEVFR